MSPGASLLLLSLITGVSAPRLVVEYMEDQLEGEAGLEGAGVEERHQLAVQRGQVGGGQGGLACPGLVLGL